MRAFRSLVEERRPSRQVAAPRAGLLALGLGRRTMRRPPKRTSRLPPSALGVATAGGPPAL